MGLGENSALSERSKSSPQLFSNGSLLAEVNPKNQITLSAKDVCAYVPLLPGLPKTSDGKEKQVLFDISMCVEPGSMLALMGPSGSGKSSLLTILGGRSTARVTGDILFNGQKLTKPVKRKMGFVTQDDMLFGELTVYETLYYAARLRLPSTWSLDAKVERVEMVIRGLGMERCRDTIVGNHMRRGVSGGERKRVSIGHELLINPSILMLDEPTSGLDSTTALRLIHTLRSLASGGRVVIASIHQPSSRLYQEMDSLLLLSEGHTLYYGEAHAAAFWMASQGHPVPFGVSTPDHLLDLACGDLPGGKNEIDLHHLVKSFRSRTIGRSQLGIQAHELGASISAPQQRLPSTTSRRALPPPPSSQGSPNHSGSDFTSAAPDAHMGIVAVTASETKGDEHVVSILKQAGSTTAQGQDSRSVVVHIPGEETGALETEPGAEEAQEGKWGASWLEQVIILSTRSVRVRRFEAHSWQRYAEVLITAVLAGLFWFQLGGRGTISEGQVHDLAGLLFFQILFMSFSSMFVALFTFPADFNMLVKERLSGMYRLSSYYVARSISELPMDCAIPIIFSIIIYWMSGLRISAGAFFCNLASMLLTMLVAQSIGLLLGATINHLRTALAMATILMLCVMLVGGFYVAAIPVWIAWLKYGSFIYWGYNLMLKIEFSGRGYSCDDFYQKNPGAPPGQTWCSVSSGGIFEVNVDSPVTNEVCVLIGMLIFLRICIYVALKVKTTFKHNN